MSIYDKITEAEKRFKKLLDGDKNANCFLTGCNKKSIGSHSLSESKVLKLLEGKDEKNKTTLYYLGDELIGDRQKLELTYFNYYHQKLKSVSKSKASVFYGFCGTHDNEIFQKIDNECYSNNDHVNFLHNYRAFSYFITQWINLISFHKNFIEPQNLKFNDNMKSLNEVIRNMPSLEKPNTPINFQLSEKAKADLLTEIDDISKNQFFINKETLKKNLISGVLPFLENGKSFSGEQIDELLKRSIFELNQANSITNLNESFKLVIDEKLKEIEKIKNEIESIWNSKIFSNLYSTSLSLKNLYLVSGSFVYEEDNQKFSLTILPEKETNRTHFIFGCLDKSASIFFSKLNIRDEDELKKHVSKIILEQGSNLYISPKYWSVLPQEIRDYWLTDRKLRILNEGLNLFEKCN